MTGWLPLTMLALPVLVGAVLGQYRVWEQARQEDKLQEVRARTAALREHDRRRNEDPAYREAVWEVEAAEGRGGLRRPRLTPTGVRWEPVDGYEP